MNVLKFFKGKAALLILFAWLAASCNAPEGNSGAAAPVAPSVDSVPAVSAATDTLLDSVPQTVAQEMILPGARLGRVKIGLDAAALDSLLGAPDKSDAAMGKAWLTWKGKSDGGKKSELDIFTAYADTSMKGKTVQQMRTTSDYFKTAAGLGVGSSLANVQAAFPQVRKVAQYLYKAERFIVYDEAEAGISFEISKGNCTGVIVHEAGEPVTKIYRTLHPDMTVYEGTGF